MNFKLISRDTTSKIDLSPFPAYKKCHYSPQTLYQVRSTGDSRLVHFKYFGSIVVDLSTFETKSCTLTEKVQKALN